MNSPNSGKLNTALWLAVLGAMLGGAVSMLMAPHVISWYFRPPAQMGFSCSEPIQWALSKLQDAGIIGACIGTIAGLALYFAAFHRRHRQGLGSGAQAV